MRKYLVYFFSSLGFLSFVIPAFATTINTCPKGNGFDPLCNLNADSIGNLISTGINLIFILAVLLALGFLIFGGVKWLTSQGEKEGVGKARETIVAAIVGLVIIFLSYLILNVVLHLFVPNVSLSNLQLPSFTQ